MAAAGSPPRPSESAARAGPPAGRSARDRS
jgi:hypothetical protein